LQDRNHFRVGQLYHAPSGQAKTRSRREDYISEYMKVTARYGVYRFYRGEKLQEYRIWQYAICPLISTVALLWVGVEVIVPLPPAPLLYAPALVGVWLAAGCILVWWMSRTGREAWLLQAGEIAHETPLPSAQVSIGKTGD